MRRTPPLIVGGGPAGSAAAIALSAQGVRATLLERSRETGDALCGGFLSWRTLESLEALGVRADQLGGHAVTQLRLFHRDRSVEALLPGGAIGVSRHRLDTLLLDRARAVGTAVERGVTIKRLEPGNRLITATGDTLSAETLFLATGKHDLAGLGRRRASDPALGLRVRLTPHPRLRQLCSGAIELHLFKDGYAGLVLQEDGSGNLCLAVRKSRLARAGGDPATLLSQLANGHPHLASRLSYLSAEQSVDAIGAVPYGWVARTTRPGQFRLGDQAGVIPSLAGEGMGIAIASGLAAAQAWGAGSTAAAFQKQFANRVARPISNATMIWRAAEHRRGPPLGLAATRLFPALAGTLARATRIRD